MQTPCFNILAMAPALPFSNRTVSTKKRGRKEQGAVDRNTSYAQDLDRSRGAGITTAFIERGLISSLDITRSAVEPTGRLVDDEAMIVTILDGMTPHTAVLGGIKEATPIALGQFINLPNSKRPPVERYPTLCQSKIHSSK